MASGNRYQLTLNGTLLGEPCANVFYYKASGGAAIASDLTAAWDTAVRTDWTAVTSVEYTFVNLVAINMDNLADFAFDPYPGSITGGVSGECLPRANAWTFQYVRATRASRHGWKRVGGVPESQQNNGVATAGAVTLLNTLATTLFTNLTAVGTTFTPVIFRYYSVPFDPLNPVVLDDFPVASVDYRYIGTQNSRKHN